MIYCFSDILAPLPISSKDIRSSSVVVIRSISNKTSFESPDEFYRQMHQSDVAPSEAHRHHAAISDSGTAERCSS